MRIVPLANVEPNTPNVMLPRPLLRVGAILEAIAVRDVTNGGLWLQFDNQQKLPARIASGYQPGPADGEVLKLRVLRDSPVLALETIDESSIESVTDEALRRILPQQTSPASLLANLAWLARRPQLLALLPPVVQRAVAQLWVRLPDATRLGNAAELQEALLHSGTFLEAELVATQNSPATAQAALQRDYKAALLTLRAQLRLLPTSIPARTQPATQVPSLSTHVNSIGIDPATLAVADTPAEQLSELKQQVEGSVARVQTNQLLNQQAAQQGIHQWLIELPVRYGHQAELLRFKFGRESRRDADVVDAWSVEVALDLDALGTLHAELQWHSQQGLNIKLRSDRPALIAALNQELPTLNSALHAQGLPINRIVCLHGLPVDSAATRLNKLLDLHA
jgi:hypothetical protein